MNHNANLYQKKLARSRQDLSNFLIALGLSFGIVMMILQLQLGIGVEVPKISVVWINANLANNYLNSLTSVNRYFTTMDDYEGYLEELENSFLPGGADTIYTDVAVSLANREYRYLQIIRGLQAPAREIRLIIEMDADSTRIGIKPNRISNVQNDSTKKFQFENMERAWNFYNQNVKR